MQGARLCRLCAHFCDSPNPKHSITLGGVGNRPLLLHTPRKGKKLCEAGHEKLFAWYAIALFQYTCATQAQSQKRLMPH